MERGAWRAIVHGTTRVVHDLMIKSQTHREHRLHELFPIDDFT